MSAQRKIAETVTIVGDEPVAPNLGDAAERSVAQALANIEELQRPMVLRASVRRRRMEKELREVDALIEELRGQETLLHQAFDAAMASIVSHRDDLEEERTLLRRGLGEADE